MQSAKCRGCQKPIRWIKMRATGANMPVDPKPVAVIVYDHELDRGMRVEGYVPHWGTCPKVDRFKKPAAGQEPAQLEAPVDGDPGEEGGNG